MERSRRVVRAGGMMMMRYDGGIPPGGEGGDMMMMRYDGRDPAGW